MQTLQYLCQKLHPEIINSSMQASDYSVEFKKTHGIRFVVEVSNIKLIDLINNIKKYVEAPRSIGG